MDGVNNNRINEQTQKPGGELYKVGHCLVVLHIQQHTILILSLCSVSAQDSDSADCLLTLMVRKLNVGEPKRKSL